MAKSIGNLQIFIVLLLGFTQIQLIIIKHFQNISMQLYCIPFYLLKVFCVFIIEFHVADVGRGTKS